MAASRRLNILCAKLEEQVQEQRREARRAVDSAVAPHIAVGERPPAAGAEVTVRYGVHMN